MRPLHSGFLVRTQKALIQVVSHVFIARDRNHCLLNDRRPVCKMNLEKDLI